MKQDVFTLRTYCLMAVICILMGLIANDVSATQIERCQPSQVVLQFKKNDLIMNVKIRDRHNPGCTLKELEYMSRKYFSEPFVELNYLGNL